MIMTRPGLFGLVLYPAVVAGCVSQDPDTKLVPAGPFGSAGAAPPITRASFTPAATETAAQVDALGRKLLAANKQTGVRPLFRTIGTPSAEVFHQGTSEVVITEGLVKQCKTEGELAAILSLELGKMVAEREALAGPQARNPERLPPPDVPIGNDRGGAFGSADGTRLAELAKFDKERRRMSAPTPPPPDPKWLAASYLERAGYQKTDLDAAAPLLEAAARNVALERQMAPQAPPPRP